MNREEMIHEVDLSKGLTKEEKEKITLLLNSGYTALCMFDYGLKEMGLDLSFLFGEE